MIMTLPGQTVIHQSSQHLRVRAMLLTGLAGTVMALGVVGKFSGNVRFGLTVLSCMIALSILMWALSLLTASRNPPVLLTLSDEGLVVHALDETPIPWAAISHASFDPADDAQDPLLVLELPLEPTRRLAVQAKLTYRAGRSRHTVQVEIPLDNVAVNGEWLAGVIRDRRTTGPALVD